LLILLILSVILNIVFSIFIMLLSEYGHKETLPKKENNDSLETLRKETSGIVTCDESLKIDTFSFSEVDKIDEKPKQISSPKAKWPEGERGEFANIVVGALVDTNGSVIDAIILKTGGNRIFDDRALTAIRKAKFTPAKHNGKLVRVWLAVPIVFTLE